MAVPCLDTVVLGTPANSKRLLQLYLWNFCHGSCCITAERLWPSYLNSLVAPLTSVRMKWDDRCEMLGNGKAGTGFITGSVLVSRIRLLHWVPGRQRLVVVGSCPHHPFAFAAVRNCQWREWKTSFLFVLTSVLSASQDQSFWPYIDSNESWWSLLGW